MRSHFKGYYEGFIMVIMRSYKGFVMRIHLKCNSEGSL